MKRNTFFRNLNILIRNQIEKIIKRITTIAVIMGCLMIKYSTPKTDASSATLAAAFVPGMVVLLIATREVALVRWESSDTVPVKRATGI